MKKFLLSILIIIITVTGVNIENVDAAIELYSYSLFGDANLQGYWRFEGNSNDSKNTNNGTDTNITYGVSYGKFGQGLYDAGAGYISIPNNSSLNFTSSFSAFCWIKTATSDVRFIQKWNGSNGWTLYSVGSSLAYYAQINGSYKNRANGATFTDNNWHQVGLTYDGSNVKLWFDGLQTSTSFAATGNVNNTTGPLIIGASEGFASNMNGNIDDCFVMNRALSATEISNYYNASPPVSTVPIASIINFD